MQGFNWIAPLFVPANRTELFTKAATSRADAIILDLEDAVGADRKDGARATLRADFTAKPIIVRVNAVETPWHEADVDAVRFLPFAAVMLPKADLASVQKIARVLPKIPIIALIESALGLADVRAIAGHGRVCRLSFGSLDYALDLGCAHTREALLSARSELVLASKLGAICPPLDGVTQALTDETLVESDARHAATMGFTGKLCIHPAQVMPAVRGFAPDVQDVAWARTALQPADGAAQADGLMVDTPVRLRAQAVLDRSVAISEFFKDTTS